jgi:RNA polymerase sigma factor (sigma-70 family)
MTKTAASPILQLIRRLAKDQRLTEVPDQELLGRFSSGRDEAAFNALLRRHGSMVLDVCRNILRNEHDAEDAFQATFLVLAEKARAIRKKSSVGSWLYGVAYRTAVKAQAQLTKRQKHEAGAPSRTATTAADHFTWREVQQVLHAELNGLSERYRAALVHCYLEGKTQDQAALLLGVSRATVKKRLERGRALLRARLVRRGLGPAAVLAACAWPAATAPAAVSPALLASTIKAATAIAAGTATAAGVISPRVVALTQGVLKAMFLTKLKVTSVVVVAVSLGAGVAGWSYGMAGTLPQQVGQEEGAARRAERPLADELEALRLEMDALRKEVRASRARIQALEAEVRGQKGKGTGVAQPAVLNGHPDAYLDRLPNAGLATFGHLQRARSERPYDVFAEAEAALKKLHANPRDKQAAEALEQATRRLKARTEVEGTGTNGPKKN